MDLHRRHGAGLVRTEVDERGKVTTSSYRANGDLAEVVDPIRLRVARTYDERAGKCRGPPTATRSPQG